MPSYDAQSAQCQVFTFKEGLLSTVAHDLELKVGRFEVEIDDATRSVKATFDPASIRVVGARKGGITDPGVLSAKDLRQIEENIGKDVLEPATHPEIRFDSSEVKEQAGGLSVTGTLFLHGRRKQLSFPVRREGERWVAELSLHQPDFGIRPYSAMLGALKVKPAVTVRLSLPASDSGNRPV